jgi:hypothetical protein
VVQACGPWPDQTIPRRAGLRMQIVFEVLSLQEMIRKFVSFVRDAVFVTDILISLPLA